MDKLQLLEKQIQQYQSLAVAYSGGADSAFLVCVAHKTLGDNALAVIVDSPTLARNDLIDAVNLLQQLGVKHEIVQENPLEDADFANNNTQRCYFCKKNNFTLIRQVAQQYGITFVADGQNADDNHASHRPGLQAGKEAGVVSPLIDCGFSKNDVRYYSKLLHLPTWNKPQNACLSSRIPYGITITNDKLAAVEAAENILKNNGFNECRVRWHHNIARIEIPKQQFNLLLDHHEIIQQIKNLGFVYVTLDLDGLRSGSMNEIL
jgi:uncharacterized protein